jgi:hypothetical protein
MNDDWEQAKRELLEGEFRGHRKLAQQKEQMKTQASPGTPLLGQRSAMDNKMLKYVKVIHSLNDHRRNGQPFALLSAFGEVASLSDERDVVCFLFFFKVIVQ